MLTHCEGTQTSIDKDKTTFVDFPSYGLTYFAHFAENFPNGRMKISRKLMAQLMFKILKGNMPLYLKSLFSSRTTEYNFRNNQRDRPII